MGEGETLPALLAADSAGGAGGAGPVVQGATERTGDDDGHGVACATGEAAWFRERAAFWKAEAARAQQSAQEARTIIARLDGIEKAVVEAVFKEFARRKGFDWWWWDIDTATQAEIKETLGRRVADVLTIYGK